MMLLGAALRVAVETASQFGSSHGTASTKRDIGANSDMYRFSRSTYVLYRHAPGVPAQPVIVTPDKIYTYMVTD